MTNILIAIAIVYVCGAVGWALAAIQEISITRSVLREYPHSKRLRKELVDAVIGLRQAPVWPIVVTRAIVSAVALALRFGKEEK